MVDIKGAIEAGRGSLDRLIQSIPGYKGYAQKNERREADKLLRTYIAEQMASQQRRLTELQLQLISNGELALVDDLDRAIKKIQLFVDRIRTATYGYAGFFDAVKVKETQLDALYDFDNAMLNEVAKVSTAVDQLEAAVAGNEDVSGTILHCVAVTQDVNYTFDRRQEVILGGETGTSGPTA